LDATVTSIRAADPQLKTCEQCGEEWAPFRADARYCSSRCRQAADRERRRHVRRAINPGLEKGYALDFGHAVRHVATELDDARPGGRTVEEMAATYDHPIPGDLSRVRRHHGLASNEDAIRLLVERAVLALGHAVKADDRGQYRLVTRRGRLRYEGKSVASLTQHVRGRNI
jgi:hypothetical protein